jgi:phosphatidylglycerophosphate synthase
MRHECVILAEPPTALVELCGISLIERLLRTLERCKLSRAIILTSTPEILEKNLAPRSRFRSGLDLKIRARSLGPLTVKQIIDVWPAGATDLLIIPSDAVFDRRLLLLIDNQNSPAVLVDSAVPASQQSLTASASGTGHGQICGPILIRHDWAVANTGAWGDALSAGLQDGALAALDVAHQPTYSEELRREFRPFWFPAPLPAQRKLAERLILNSAQKGTLDIPARLHSPIEDFIIARLCKTSVTPNQLTILCNVVGWVVTILFATGHLVLGTALAFSIGILDGIDGKQARVKVETSPAGKLEHWFDTIFEFSWWIALAYYFQSSGQLPGAYRYLLLLLAAEGIDALAKGSVLFSYGRLIDELSPFDRFVRLIGGRRDIYIVILAIGLLVGNAAKAFVVMAWWEAATAAVHITRAGWEILVKRHPASPAQGLS